METDLTNIENLDRLSRKQWSKMAASTLISLLGQDGSKALVARGFNHFVADAKRAYHGHAFRFEDFKRMFDLVRLASEGKVTAKSVLR